MKLARALLFAGVIGAPSLACAQPFQGVYVGGAAGATFMGQESIHSSSALGLPSGRAAFSDGFVGLGSLGYGFGNGIRVELEGSWRDNPLHQVLRPNEPTAASGRQTITAIMANALFDLDIRSRWIYPYLGAGIGYAWTKWNGVEASGPDSLYRAYGTSGNFAFQAMFGLSFPVPHVPGLSFTAEYRFFDVPGSLTYRSSFEGGGQTTAGDTVLHFNHSQSLLLGVRYAIGVTPPEGVAQPAQSLAQPIGPGPDFLVSFAGAGPGLDTRDRATLANAAARALSGTPTTIVLAGTTERETKMAEAQLIANGVPAGAIALAAGTKATSARAEPPIVELVAR